MSQVCHLLRCFPLFLFTSFAHCNTLFLYVRIYRWAHADSAFSLPHITCRLCLIYRNVTSGQLVTWFCCNILYLSTGDASFNHHHHHHRDRSRLFQAPSTVCPRSVELSTALDSLLSLFLHRDLAARNCLITSRLDIKISCPALSRDSYSAEYSDHHNRKVPLRWTPAEALFEDEWSTKSDVYSFAVLAWEVFSRGQLPHSERTDAEVLTLLRSGELRWTSPAELTTPALAQLLERCWQRSPRDRPSFGEVAVRIGEIFVDSNV